MLTFDEKGLLFPHEIIEISLDYFEEKFVNELEDHLHRREIFQGYQRYLDALKKITNRGFTQFLNGSFTTQKIKPNDLDVVTLLDYDVMMKNLGMIKNLDRQARNWKIDSHFSYTCKHNHRFFEKSLEFYAFWKELYSFSRADSLGNRQPKGLIKINFLP